MRIVQGIGAGIVDPLMLMLLALAAGPSPAPPSMDASAAEPTAVPQEA
ncbi:hypothetical protein [Nocardia sp. NPDC059228]